MEINFGKRNAYHLSFNFLTNNLVLTIFCFFNLFVLIAIDHRNQPAMLVHDKEALEDILVNRKKRAIGRGDDIIKEAVKKIFQ